MSVIDCTHFQPRRICRRRPPTAPGPHTECRYKSGRTTAHATPTPKAAFGQTDHQHCCFQPYQFPDRGKLLSRLNVRVVRLLGMQPTRIGDNQTKIVFDTYTYNVCNRLGISIEFGLSRYSDETIISTVASSRIRLLIEENVLVYNFHGRNVLVGFDTHAYNVCNPLDNS